MGSTCRGFKGSSSHPGLSNQDPQRRWAPGRVSQRSEEAQEAFTEHLLCARRCPGHLLSSPLILPTPWGGRMVSGLLDEASRRRIMCSGQCGSRPCVVTPYCLFRHCHPVMCLWVTLWPLSAPRLLGTSQSLLRWGWIFQDCSGGLPCSTWWVLPPGSAPTSSRAGFTPSLPPSPSPGIHPVTGKY